MRSAERLDHGNRVLGQGVDHVVGAEFLRELQLLVVDVDRDDGGAADLRVLQCEMAEATDAEDRDQLVRGSPRRASLPCTS